MKFTHRSRLRSKTDFSFVFARPSVSRDRCFRILTRPNDKGFSRLGMAVSRKICRGAVGRNRLKRMVRESFRLHQDELGRTGGLDIVVLPSGLAATLCNRTLHESLNGHWQTIGACPVKQPDEDNRKRH